MSSKGSARDNTVVSAFSDHYVACVFALGLPRFEAHPSGLQVVLLHELFVVNGGSNEVSWTNMISK